MVLPVRQPGGHIQNFLVQHGSQWVGMVPMADYQQQGFAAPPTVRIQRFGELLESKDLGLFLVHFGASGLDRSQAEQAFRAVVFLYCQRPGWPQTFNERPADFCYATFLAHFEALPL